MVLRPIVGQCLEVSRCFKHVSFVHVVRGHNIEPVALSYVCQSVIEGSVLLKELGRGTLFPLFSWSYALFSLKIVACKAVFYDNVFLYYMIICR